MPMKMERNRTKGTNVQRLNRMPKNIEHGRTDSYYWYEKHSELYTQA